MESENNIQKVMDNSSKPAEVIAVASGKGGVGKTNIAANLAVCLGTWGKKVLLFDADLSLGNLDVVMDIPRKYNISHALNGEKSIDEIICYGPEGIEIICGGSGIKELANLNPFQRQRLINELDNLQKKRDVIIIDNAAGIANSVIGFCLASDQTLIVTTPQAPAITDAYAMIKVLAGHNYNRPINLLVNWAESPKEGKRVYRQIAKVASQFLDKDINYAGTLPKDKSITDAVRKRKPVVQEYPKAKISTALASVAARLTVSVPLNNDNKAFFKRVVDWFF